MKISTLLKEYRRERRLSVNQLYQLTGISRRTLARIEMGYYERKSRGSGRGPLVASRLSPLIAHKLATVLLPKESLEEVHQKAIRLDHFALLFDELHPDQHMPMLFHRVPLGFGSGDESVPDASSSASNKIHGGADIFTPQHFFAGPVCENDPTTVCHPEPVEGSAFPVHCENDPTVGAQRKSAVAENLRLEYLHHFGPHLLRLVRLSPKNLRPRLRVFRMKHSLTLKETAWLCGLSTSHLHAIESGARSPSPKVRFQLLRLLTLPISNSKSSPGSHPKSSPVAPATGSTSQKQSFLQNLKHHLSLPPPIPVSIGGAGIPACENPPDPLDLLRYLWLTGTADSHSLATVLEIGQPHLIRILRNDRQPSAALLERIVHFWERLTRKSSKGYFDCAQHK